MPSAIYWRPLWGLNSSRISSVAERSYLEPAKSDNGHLMPKKFGVSGPKPLRRALLKNSPDLMSTPLFFPLATRERTNVISLGKGILRLRVKSETDSLISGSMFLGIRLRKDPMVSPSWQGFPKHCPCHGSQLLEKLLVENKAPVQR